MHFFLPPVFAVCGYPLMFGHEECPPPNKPAIGPGRNFQRFPLLINFPKERDLPLLSLFAFFSVGPWFGRIGLFFPPHRFLPLVVFITSAFAGLGSEALHCHCIAHPNPPTLVLQRREAFLPRQCPRKALFFFFLRFFIHPPSFGAVAVL